jgi:Spore Coat Protein U domain
MKTLSVWRWLALLAMALCGTAAQAAINCNVSARNLGELYDPAANNSVQGDLRISCTRTSVGDPSTVFYSIKASYGLNSTVGVTRNVRDPVSNSTLLWVLRTGAAGNTTDWGTAASPGLLTGSLSFAGSALFTNALINNAYSMRVRGNLGGLNSNPAAPSAGTYVDTVTLTPDMSTTGITGPFNVTAPVTQMSFSVGVGSQCVVRKQGDDLTFNYAAFGGAQSDTSNFQAVCSAGLPYTVSFSPTSGTIAGVAYTLSLVGNNPGRNGTGNQQAANIRVDVAGGQAGSCASSSCAGTAVHTVTLTY